MFSNRIIKRALAIAMVLALTFGICACGGSSKPSEETYQAAYEKKIDSLTESLSKYYETAQGVDVSNMSAEVELSIGLSEALLSLLRSNTTYDFDWVNDTVIKLAANMKDDAVAIDAGVSYDGKDVANGKVIMDSASGDVFVGVPTLSDLFATTNLNDQADMVAGVGAIGQLAETDILALLPNEKNLGTVIKKCITAVIENMPEIAIEEGELDVDGIKQACAVYTVKLSEKDITNIEYKVLETLCDDMAFEKLITDFVREANNAGLDTGTTPQEAYEDIIYELESAMEDIEDDLQGDYLSDETVLVLTSYITNKQEIIGIELEIDSYSMIEFYAATARSKDDVATRIYAEVDGERAFEISGDLTDDGKKLSGTYEIEIQGQSMAFVDLKDVDVKKLDDGYFTGTVSLSPSKGLIDMISSETDIDLSMVGLTLGSLSLKLDVTKNDGKAFDAKLSLMSGTEEYVSLGLKSKTGNGSKITVPTNTTEDIELWTESLDLNKLVDSIEESGLPQYIVDLANMLVVSPY